jgi:DNA-binding NtrC family response regulator
MRSVREVPDEARTRRTSYTRYGSAHPPQESDLSPSRDRPLVFHVDDEASLRLVTKRLLAQRGFDVIEAGSAAEAESVIEQHAGEIDALLMDILLPDGWGNTLAQRLRTTHPEMAVVYTTGYAESDPVLAAALADAAYVIRKPYTGEGLADMLLRAIAGA